jgi:tetratricopeptide (TPR) repeat protein
VTPESQSNPPAPEPAPAGARAGSSRAAIEALARPLPRDASPDVRAVRALALADAASGAETHGDPALAELALAAALEARPDFADLHCRRARLLVRLDRRAEARRALDRALELNPRFVEARLERALLEAREGRVGESLESLRRLSTELRVAEPQVFQQGLWCIERSDWERADSLLRRGLAVENAELAAALQSARDGLARGDADGVAASLRRLLDRHPAYPDLHALLGAAEFQRGHFDDAMNALARSLELNPDFHDARVEFARVLESLGAFSAAADQAALVLEHAPGNAAALEMHERWNRRRSSGTARRFTAA